MLYNIILSSRACAPCGKARRKQLEHERSVGEPDWFNKTKAVKNVNLFTICNGSQTQIIRQLEFNFFARSL